MGVEIELEENNYQCYIEYRNVGTSVMGED